jgi:hypothetical protein
LAAALVTERLRDCAPVPHDLVQVLQLENALVSQWTALACSEQGRVSSRYGQP